MAEDKGLTRSEREEKVLQFWKDNKIFEKSLEKDAPEGNFVFYEGPPTANGRPAIHHLEARSFKDAIPRYRTMRGYKVPRKAGWDTHGLPVELEVEKSLGLKSKKEIEAYGIAEFNKKCKESVGAYIDEWSRFTDRIGYWVNLDDAYYTYDNSYMEAEWGILAHVEKRGLLYKDYKVVPWCPRCGTALSSHELAQGYQDVKDLSLYVKFKVTDGQGILKSSGRFAQPDIPVFLLAWTTTPWTLPGNLALAVGEDIDYVKVKLAEAHYILAEARLSVLEGEYEVVKKMKGKDLVGLSYEPLYNFVTPNDKTYKVYTADFVTTEDGTGIVHTAVMYGQEDFELGTKVGLPKQHLVSPDGTFVEGTGWLSGRSVVDLPALPGREQAGDTLAIDILKDLQSRGLLFAKENHLHSYPFCWRCKTRLIYYARDSWYIKMSALRDKLVEENEKINWEPEYIKEGRFGEWLREVKDWAISRERYWGTPLPFWINDNGERLVVDSLKTLKKYSRNNGNKYLVMRHGGTESNATDIVSYAKEAVDHLTEKGRTQSAASAQKLKGKVDVIVSSPFARTKETAEIVAEELGIDPKEVIYDKRICELNTGQYDGKSWTSYHQAIKDSGSGWFTQAMPNGESLFDVRKRVGECLYDVEKRFKGKNILFVTHGSAAWLLFVLAGEFEPTNDEYEVPDSKAEESEIFTHTFKRFENAEVRELDFAPLPHDGNFATDLHRPYIDNVVLVKDGKEYERIREILDVWFDSGSMPFASEKLFPADFISEGLDQTRGWFYTLHAISTLMEKGIAYKNVICLGLLLDKEGKKMAKSVGNIVDPWEEARKFGVDVLRFWMYSINQPGENKNYDERTVVEVERRVFNLLDNVHAFYELYRDKSLEENEVPKSESVLDQWILVRLSMLSREMREHLDAYKLLEPARDLRDFIDDLSTWYLRRSRERLKEGEEQAKKTLYFVLKTVSRLLAPFAPFAAEELYQKLRTNDDAMSVHLESWPGFAVETRLDESSILASMKDIRALVTLALEARSKAGLKIRQPLSRLTVRAELSDEFLEILADEVNVKQVVVDNSMDTDVVLDTTLTPELIEEGEMRELVRSIQDLRKERGLKPGETLEYEVPEDKRALFLKFKDSIVKATNVAPHL